MTELINTAVVHCLAKIMPLSSETTLKEIFFKACRGNELNKVRSVLTLDADVNWRDADGLSGVNIAARYNFHFYHQLVKLNFKEHLFSSIFQVVEINSPPSTPLFPP